MELQESREVPTYPADYIELQKKNDAMEKELTKLSMDLGERENEVFELKEELEVLRKEQPGSLVTGVQYFLITVS